MAVVGPSVRTSPRRHVDVVITALCRLIVVSRIAYREALVDVLYQYRRREGTFVDGPRVTLKKFRPRPMIQLGVGPRTGYVERPGPALPVKGKQEPGRLPNPRTGRRLEG